MTDFEKFIDDMYDLMINGQCPESFIRITCPEGFDTDLLIRQFRAGLIKARDGYFKQFFEKYTTDKYRYSVPDELNIRFTRNKNILVGKYTNNVECEIYGENVPWLIYFGFDVINPFLSDFFDNPEFMSCKYENVFVTSQEFSVQSSLTVAISSNIENNDYEYSFNRIYKRLLHNFLEDERMEYSWRDIYPFIEAKWMNEKKFRQFAKLVDLSRVYDLDEPEETQACIDNRLKKLIGKGK